MKALCISDAHAKIGFLESLEFFLAKEQPEAIFFTGDIVNHGQEIDYLKKFNSIILNSGIPLFWVPGNNDIGPVYELMRRKKYSVEDKFVQYGGEKIVGMGGAPDLWGHNIYYPKVKENEIKDSIFLSHIPPKNFVNFKKHDHKEYDKNVELKNAPKIQICGHQHSYWGVGYIGKTKILKVPAGLNMMAAILDTETLKVEFINITDYNKKHKVILR